MKMAQQLLVELQARVRAGAGERVPPEWLASGKVMARPSLFGSMIW